jgi:CelD/BcsL family acetyltransferase involved in cellulose biosynthesis
VPTTFETSVAAAVDQIDAVAEEWDDLAQRTGADPWHRPAWYRIWWLAFGDGPLHVYSVRREGRLVAVAPIVRGQLGWQTPTNWHSPAFSIVAEDEAARGELVEQILAARPSWLTLPFMQPSEAETVVRAAAKRGYRALVRTQMRSPYVPTDGPLENLWETDIDTHKSPRELARRRKKLDGRGNAEFVVDDGRNHIDELLAEALPIEASGWKAELGTAIVSRPDTLQFYDELMRWASDEGILRAMYFRVDGVMVACELCFAYGDRLAIIKGGIDPMWKKYAVGVLTHFEITRYCFEHDITSLEWLGDEAPHKRAWTSKSRELKLVQLFRPDPLGAGAYSAYAYGRPLAKRALARVKR